MSGSQVAIDFNPAESMSAAEAEVLLADLAAVFYNNSSQQLAEPFPQDRRSVEETGERLPEVNEVYRSLVEQIPAVVFMAYLDRGIGEAYVSPQIEAALGFSQEEWLEDPVRWFHHIHPEDKQRWSVEAAQMFLSGSSLESAYRVIARDGKVVWFQCVAKMIRRKDGRPWLIHGVAFDITELKQTEEALQKERNVVSAILDTVGALVVVLDSEGRIVRLNRAGEQTLGFQFSEVKGKFFWHLFSSAEEAGRFRSIFDELEGRQEPYEFESSWITQQATQRLIAWSVTMLVSDKATPAYIIATGIDITERKRLENAILDISSREQRRIGQDLHDGLGQHLTGIAFMSKVQEQRLAEKSLPEAVDAAKIVQLVNEAIHKTRELAHGLLPVVSDAHGLMSALQQWVNEVQDLFGISCVFRVDVPVLVDDASMATHLYRIAQEAVHNAIKHGKASHIEITLAIKGGKGTLKVEDDGTGLPEPATNNTGMGLQIMDYRARMIGGSLAVGRGARTGTIVTCVFPRTQNAGMK